MTALIITVILLEIILLLVKRIIDSEKDFIIDGRINDMLQVPRLGLKKAINFLIYLFGFLIIFSVLNLICN